MSKNRFNVYLFDFDGTLVDSMPTYASSMLRILDENNVDYPDDTLKTITPLGLLGAAKHFLNQDLQVPPLHRRQAHHGGQ